jgi:hypothetical protein
MWEHGMPGSAWTMALELARWDELRGDDEGAAAAPEEARMPSDTRWRRPRLRLPHWQRRPGTVPAS